MKVKKVINIFGGPGVGKSTVAAGLFFRMKCKGMSVELIPEFAKSLTYEKRFDVLTNDQLYIFANQHRSINVVAQDVEYVIVDSPLLLTQIYFNPESNLGELNLLMPLVLNMFNRYPNDNYLLTRNSKLPYQEYGRSQTLDEAKEIDGEVAHYLRSHSIPHREVMASESAVELILQDVLKVT